MTRPESLEPTIDTRVIRAIVERNPRARYATGVTPADVLELCDAVDTLRRQFAGANTYITALHARLNTQNSGPHPDTPDTAR